ncbi:ParB/RepB/Spo0J family partition protein [Curtobacterium flaccumfaciens]|uniref:ParB/RepB/Spo0J family partition protein n=1 Tax=Curtobacterium flaccumfaciens TaxID=2035 RepID=UPI00188B0DDE|nr:ParB N-terminal domain-containing protein [Curtobacterium flaccumfaciens]MBF4628919.1 ParB N-terminal domain-containing protein [Curtobacterium flaccumfaciens]
MSNEGTVVRVDPATLIVAANVRSNTKVTKEFVASVKLHGVLVPITAQEAEDGLRVVDGQRRTLAAVEAGLQEVAVFVVAPLEDAARVVDQVVVNEHREGLDQVEQVLALKELEQLGVSAAAIARRTGTKRKVVDGALSVAASEAATAAMRENQLSFDAAIAVAEFEDDPEAQKRILSMNASSYSIAQERERRAREERKAQLEADGMKVIDRPDYDDARTREVGRLYLDEGRTQPLGDLEQDELAKVAGDGLRAYVYLGWSSQMEGREVQVGYAVSGWKDRGLFGYEPSTSSAPKPETPEEIAAAKDERRRARESTRAWATSTTVRVAWLQELLQKRGKPAPGWELLSARQSLDEPYGNYPWSMVLTLLQAGKSDGGLGKYDVVKYLDEHPTRAPQVALALALGSIEGARDFDRKGWQSPSAKTYLELLASWGYELTEVERGVSG